MVMVVKIAVMVVVSDDGGIDGDGLTVMVVIVMMVVMIMVVMMGGFVDGDGSGDDGDSGQ